MTIVPSFSEEQLRSLYEIMGETNNGLTNSQIDQLLSTANIRDPSERSKDSRYFYTPISKRDRLYAALSTKQREDRCANNVVNFIMRVMDPVSYVKNHEHFELLREQLNRNSVNFTP